MPDFDPRGHLIKLKGKDYLEVKHRLVWLTVEQPRYTIDTEPITITDQLAIFKAVITTYDDQGAVLRRATGTKSETPKGFADYVEKAETGSIGRALGALGFGTQYAVEFEGEADVGRPVDSPTNGHAAGPSFADRVHVDERPRRPAPAVAKPVAAPARQPAPASPPSAITDFTALYTKWRPKKVSNLDDIKRAIGRDAEGLSPAALDGLLEAATAGSRKETGPAALENPTPASGPSSADRKPPPGIQMTEKQWWKLWACGNEKLARQSDDGLHALALENFGHESLKQITVEEASGLIDWFESNDAETVMAYVGPLLRQQAIDRGQQELPIDDSAEPSPDEAALINFQERAEATAGSGEWAGLIDEAGTRTDYLVALAASSTTIGRLDAVTAAVKQRGTYTQAFIAAERKVRPELAARADALTR